MDPSHIYNYLVRARERVFDVVRPLSDEQYAREFAIGPGTLGMTLTHIMISEWYYVQRIADRAVPSYETWPIRQEDPPAFTVLETAWRTLVTETRTVLDVVDDWDCPIEYDVTSDEGAAQIITTSPAGLFTQLMLHETHHRAQVINILRQLGVSMEDVDYNAMMFGRRDGMGLR